MKTETGVLRLNGLEYERDEGYMGKKHSKALWCLNVISDRSNRQAFREKKQRIQKESTLAIIISSVPQRERV